jgi:hypothetical protein
MRLPREVWVKDAVYRISYKRGLDEFGYCDMNEKKIVIRAGLSFQERLDTLVHEISHAIEEEWDFDVKHEHIHKLSTAWAQVLVDNII